MGYRTEMLTACLLVAVLACVAACASAAGSAEGARSTSRNWGTADGKPVKLYTLTNAAGSSMSVTNYGATITELRVPDRDGKLADVVLGFDHLEGYQTKSPYFGTIAGRNANRIANGRFELDGRSYQLAQNNGPNHLHGGPKGFNKQVWDARTLSTPEGQAIELMLVSPDGDESYPGTLTATVRYTLTSDHRVLVDMTATTDAPTLCNLAQHTYFNLAGHGSGTVEDHRLKIHAEAYTPVDATLIPTGEIAPVAGTPFDFREAKPIGQDLRRVESKPVGYDHNFVIRGEPFAMRTVADVVEPTSGRTMVVRANQPGVQFYSGNFLDGTIVGKEGVTYQQYQGFCLETQVYPDAIHRPEWPQAVLRPGQTYRHQMEIRFSTVGR